MSVTASAVETATGAALGAAFRAAAAVRAAKPLHPRGVVVQARLHRRGSVERWGSPWLDEPGEDSGVARLSRSAGVPSPLPDVLGLALRLRGRDGAVHDLLLASTGVSPGARFLLWPRWDPASATYTSLLPYRSATGCSVWLAALPVGLRRLPSEPGALPAELAREPLRLELAAATGTGPWQPVGTLEVFADGTEADTPVSFDPVLNPLPGLWLPGPLARVRAMSYTGARAGRGAGADQLTAVPAGLTPPGA
ncbi:MAG: hypothetical protein M3Q27_16570, partial [Actinomycetota bacterium]|nr:hypothetical protein [Actinomycetota bacterium]